MDDTESSDKELKKSDQGNPHNTDTDSFFKPYLDAQEKDNTYEKWKERNQKYRGGNISKVNDIVLNNSPDSDNIKDEHLNERETDIRQKDEKSSKNDKTEHGMEKHGKAKVKSKPKSTPTKSKPRSHQVKENTTLGTKFAKS
ncbi:hypothetical protein Tco_1012543 [Tanacetum coccineum]